jgi:hypothetical protein
MIECTHVGSLGRCQVEPLITVALSGRHAAPKLRFPARPLAPSAKIIAMTTSPDQPQYAVQIPIRDWLVIDAIMDNHIQSAIDGGSYDEGGLEPDDGDGDEACNDDEEEIESEDDTDGDEEPGDSWDVEAEDAIREPAVAKVGMSIRQAGWDQIPGWPDDAEGFKTWPAPSQTTTVTLTGAQWDLVVSALLHWAAVDDGTDDAESAAASRAIATAVTVQLVEQGWPRLDDGSR